MFQAVVTESEIEEVAKIAREIWIEHYTPIIGIDQVEYMLDKLHSKSNIAEDIAEKNYSYFLIKKEGVIGYIGLQLKSDRLFLSKIYVASSARGHGIGRLAMYFIKELAQKSQLKKITLTVNKNNSGSIAAYLKLGFVKTGQVCADIGGGYVMDDYQMELSL